MKEKEKEKEIKEEEKQEEEEEEEEKFNEKEIEKNQKEINNIAEFAIILQFIDLFKNVLGISKDINPEKLEYFFCIDGKNSYQFLSQLHIKLLRNISNKPSSITINNWERHFKNKLNRENSFHNVSMDFSQGNPLEQSSYSNLSLKVKILLLKELCEWQLDYNEKVQEYISSMPVEEYNNFLREKPIGFDKNNCIYWHLDKNEITSRVYKEKPIIIQEEDGTLKESGEWETVCKTISEIEHFSLNFKNSTNKHEKELFKIIEENLLPPLYESEKKKISIAKKLAKMETGGVSLNNIINGERTRKKRREISYIYEDKIDN